MSYHSSGLNPIVAGTKISSAWMEYVEDTLDTYAAGTFISPATYIIRKNGAVYEAYTNGVLTYGGASNAGSTDGTDKAAVQQACVDALTSGGTVFLKENTLDGAVSYGGTILIVEDYQGTRKFYGDIDLPANTVVTADIADANVTAAKLAMKIAYPYTYFIRDNGSDFEAIAADGTLTYGGANDAGGVDGADSTAVCTAVFGDITTAGKVCFSDGTFYPSDVDLSGKKIFLQGYGKNVTVLKLPNNADKSLFKKTEAGIGTSSPLIIRDLTLDGNYTNQSTAKPLLDLNSFSTLLLNNLTLQYSKGEGLKLNSVGWIYAKNLLIKYNELDGVYIDGLTSSWFNNIVSINNKHNGLYITSDNAGLENLNITDCHFLANYYNGVHVDKTTYSVYALTIKGGSIDENVLDGAVIEATRENYFLVDFDAVRIFDNGLNQASGYNGIRLSNAGFVGIKNCSITRPSATGCQDYAIKTVNTCNFIQILNNFLRGNRVSSLSVSGSGFMIDGNDGYVTKNKGYSIGTGSQQTIAHGCGFTPAISNVFFSEATTGGASPHQSAVPDATNIYVTAVNAKDYNWLVIRT